MNRVLPFLLLWEISRLEPSDEGAVFVYWGYKEVERDHREGNRY